MSAGRRVFLLGVVGASLWFLSACGKSGCGGDSFVTSGTGGGGTTSGSGSTCNTTGGNTGNGTALDYIYTLNGFSISGSYYTGSSILTLAGFNAPSLGNGSVADMSIINGTYLYQPWVPTGGTSIIQAYSIDSTTGALSAIGGSPFSTHSVADSIVSDPKARFLFAGESGTSTVEAFQITSTGSLKLAPGSPYSLNFVPLSVAVDGTGNYVYVATDSSRGFVYGYRIDQTTGALTDIPGSPFPMSVVEVGGEPTGTFLIGRGAGVVTTMPITPGTGALSFGPTIAPASNAVNHFAVHPTGKYVYTFSQQVAGGSNFPVEGFGIDASGNLTALTGSPFTNLASIFAGKIDQKGTALVGLTPAGAFQVLVIDPTTGLLTSTSQAYTGVSNLFFAVTN
jgi:6-phosphogluconolactonase